MKNQEYSNSSDQLVSSVDALSKITQPADVNLSRQPFLFSDDFKETVTVFHLDPTLMLQYTIDGGSFYRLLILKEGEERQMLISDIASAMIKYQKKGQSWFDRNQSAKNMQYLQRLSEVGNNKKMNEKEQLNSARQMIKSWEEELGALLNYPRHLTLENGEVIHISFDFFLRSLLMKNTIKGYLRFIMERYSMANQTAYMYSRSERHQDDLDGLITLLSQQKGVFKSKTIAQQNLHAAYEMKYKKLYQGISHIRSPYERFPIIRSFMRSWYEEVIRQEEHA